MDKFNIILHGKEAKIKKISGTEFQAKNIRLSSDSIYWSADQSESDESKQVGIEETWIEQIQLSNSGKGALEGLGLGFLAGFSVGALLGIADGDDEPGWFSMTAEEKALILGPILGTLTGITGLVLGLITGHKDIFILNDPQNYYALINPEILEESNDLIEFKWRDRTLQIDRSEILILEKAERTIIYVPRETIDRILGGESEQENK